jgi:hypothetical protein
MKLDNSDNKNKFYIRILKALLLEGCNVTRIARDLRLNRISERLNVSAYITSTELCCARFRAGAAAHLLLRSQIAL